MPGLPLHLALLLSSSPDLVPVVLGITELPGGREAASRVVRAGPDEAATPPVASEPAATRVALPRLSSRFGRRSDPIRRASAIHAGIDIPGRLGTPVLASAPGVVRHAGRAGSYGEMIEIDHGGVATRYAHLSRVLVRPGMRVEQGQPVALMGSTGRSTGNHLHFEVRVAGRAVDPLGYLGGALPSPAPAKAWIAPEEPHISAFARARADEPQGRAF